MHQRTKQALAELEAADWFANVGKRDIDAGQVLILDSWQEAIKSSDGGKWEALCLEAANRYTEQLAKRDPQRFNKWNIIVKEMKPIIDPLVERKTRKVAEQNNLPKSFINTVRWDILHLCMESEYADVFPAGFYASQAYCYIKGHFPCGWQGEFPQGQQIVY